MRTEDLVRVLAADNERQPLPLGRAFALALAAGVFLAGAGFFVWVGVRPDFEAASRTIRYPFKFVVTLTLVAATLGLVWRQARPGSRGRRPRELLAAPLLLGLAVIAEMMATPAGMWGTQLIGTNALMCLTIIPLLSTGPLGCLLLALRHGAPTRPDLAGAAAGLLASGIAATFYAANCYDDSPFFVAAWYPPAIGIVVLAGRWLGARFLRW